MKKKFALIFIMPLFCMSVSGITLSHFHEPQYVDGKLVPWHIDGDGPFHYIISIEAQWWLNTPDVNGWPAYLTSAELDRNHSQLPYGAVPGSACSFAIFAYLKYYAYTGDIRYLNMVKCIGNYIIRQNLTPSTYYAYPDFPWPAGELSDTTPDGNGHPFCTVGEIMPDKGAMTGVALTKLFQATGDSSYLSAAIRIANVLAVNAVSGSATQSPWPFRVKAQTGVFVDGKVCGNQIFAIRLFDALMELGTPGSNGYAAVRDDVWRWLKTYVIPDTAGSMWQDFFEDHGGDEDNPSQIDALETARYLLEKKDALDSQWFQMVMKIISTVKNNWVVHSGSYTAIGEQMKDMTPYNSHTARYASILAMFHEAGGPVAFKDEAYSSFAYSTYSVDSDGFADTYFENDIAWTTDSYGDWMQHFMDGLAAEPDWAPVNSSRLLRSSSVIRWVAYDAGCVRYAVFSNSGTEKLKLAFEPATVRLNGKSVSSWTWDSVSKVCMVNRTEGDSVEIVAVNPVITGKTKEVSGESGISFVQNSFNPKTMIIVQDYSGRTFSGMIAVYNISGRHVASMYLQKGKAQWDVSRIPKGVYVLRVNTRALYFNKKIVLAGY